MMNPSSLEHTKQESRRQDLKKTGKKQPPEVGAGSALPAPALGGHDRHTPNLCAQPLAMEPDSSRQQIPDMFEREEMASTTSTEPQLRSRQRSPNNSILRPRSSKPDKVSHPPPWKEDLQPEDSCSPAKKIRTDKYIPDQNINNRLPPKKYYQTDLIKDSFEKQTNISDKTELFTKMKSHLTLNKESSIDIMPPDELMKSVLAYYLDKHQKEKKINTIQYAFAVAYLKKGDLIIFPAVYPDHLKGGGWSAVPTKKHSEEKLIQQIDDFLQKNGTKVIKLLVYSYNSPCLRRENSATCCMFLLLQKAAQWDNMYGFFTEVAFTKPWGLSGPNFFKGLTYSDISDPRSVFLTYTEKCKDIPFKLVIIRKENELREKLLNISSTIKCSSHNLVDRANSSCLLDHLDRGTNIITNIIMSSEFPPKDRDEIVTTLINNWIEIVNNESVSSIREKITTDFNNAVLQLFGKELKIFWEDSSPLKLYQVSQNMEGEGENVQQIGELLNQPSLPHSKRVPVLIPGVGALLCRVCMSSPCQCEFSLSTPASSHSP